MVGWEKRGRKINVQKKYGDNKRKGLAFTKGLGKGMSP